MNLQQLDAVCAIAANGLNMSLAAAALHQSQPTLSRHIQNLERELGVDIFVRTRNRIVALTAKGEEVLRIGQRIVRDAQDLARVGASETADGVGELRIATTHLHARYSLPRVMKGFAARFGNVALTLKQGDPVQCCELVAAGEADIGITTVADKPGKAVVAIPAYKLSRCVIVPRGHPLARRKSLTLQALAEYPIVAYSAPFSGRWIVEDAFARAGLKPRIVCSAIDADVSKTYVELGMGIAVLARIAYDRTRDRGLVALDADRLFAPSLVNLVIRKYSWLTRHAEEFLASFAPHVGIDVLRRAAEGEDIDRARMSRDAPNARRSVTGER